MSEDELKTIEFQFEHLKPAAVADFCEQTVPRLIMAVRWANSGKESAERAYEELKKVCVQNDVDQ